MASQVLLSGMLFGPSAGSSMSPPVGARRRVSGSGVFSVAATAGGGN